MISFYKVTPHSVLFFRDSRPFTAGEQSLARLQFPPRLTPFLGALRTKYLETMARAENKRIREIFDKYEKQVKSISIFWFSLLKNNEPILPAPIDLMTDWKLLDESRFIIEKQEDKQSTPIVPIFNFERMENFETADYITIDGFVRYIDGEFPQKKELISQKDLWKLENRVGLTLKPGAKTSERSRFYRITVARLKAEIGFLVGVEMADDVSLPDSFTTRLGGEGHIAVWKKIDGFKVSKNSFLFSELIALTHIPLKNDGELKFKVKNWCINKLDNISGWDYKENRPKPLVKALKPGAVLMTKRINGSKPQEIYEITFKNGESVFVAKNLAISIKEKKKVKELYLIDFKPELGEPNTLFIIKK